MRRTLTICMLIACCQVIAVAQNTETFLEDIRIKYAEIQKNIKSYDSTMVNIWGESTEGGQATGYFDKDSLKLIIVWWFGETGKRRMEMYYDAGELFFAFNTNYRYNRPYYYDDKMSKENNDTEIFDLNKTTVIEDRYYFHQRKLIRWIDKNKKVVNHMSSDISKAEREILEDSDRFERKLKK